MTKRQRKKRLRADDPLAALRKAQRRLDKEQGVVARRNARAAVFAEMRRLRAFIDREYPVLRSKSSTRRKRKSGKALFKHLCRNGWKECLDRSLLAAASEAGIKARRVTWWNNRGLEVARTLLPEWVEQIWKLPNASVSMLRKARRSKTERDALLMEGTFLQQKAANDA
jgi:hypothetical protein